ncbi:MAG: hypothetical protein AAF433_02960 [Bacteroidota bacterium]
MTIWDRIRQIFSPGRPPVRIDPNRELKPNSNPASDFPTSSPPTTSLMLNTLSFSSDLRQVYLINDGKVHAFQLDSEEGVTIGLLGDQIGVVTSKEVEIPTRSDQTEVPTSPERSSTKKPRVIELALDGKSAYNLQYNPAIQAMGIIGATDLISTIPGPDQEPEPTGNCSLHLFDLRRNLLRMRRSKNLLTVWEVAR